MLTAELCCGRIFSGLAGPSSPSPSSSRQSHSMSIPNSPLSSLPSHSPRLYLRFRPPPFLKFNKFPFVSCQKLSHGSAGSHDDFLQASILLSETLRHYHLRKQGFHEEVKQSYSTFVPFSAGVKDSRAGTNTIGLGILGRFQNPTIFLKVSCEEDFLLPIVVGEFAVKNLIGSSDEDDPEDHSNHFLLVRNIALDLGYEDYPGLSLASEHVENIVWVKMVQITKRVINTYFARIYFGKVGERASFSIDAHPSDAINAAKKCEAPIYVNKQIVLADAIRLAYGTGRIRDTKPTYDVLLDSPMEGPELLCEELSLLLKMKLAVKEERYKDAAMWRDKLVMLLNSAGT